MTTPAEEATWWAERAQIGLLLVQSAQELALKALAAGDRACAARCLAFAQLGAQAAILAADNASDALEKSQAARSARADAATAVSAAGLIAEVFTKSEPRSL